MTEPNAGSLTTTIGRDVFGDTRICDPARDSPPKEPDVSHLRNDALGCDNQVLFVSRQTTFHHSKKPPSSAFPSNCASTLTPSPGRLTASNTDFVSLRLVRLQHSENTTKLYFSKQLCVTTYTEVCINLPDHAKAAP